MAMSLAEAGAECERWFAHLDRQEEKTAAIGRIAAARRSGEMSHREAGRAMREIDGPGVTVYDGSRLRQAVGVLLTHLRQTGEAA